MKYFARSFSLVCAVAVALTLTVSNVFAGDPIPGIDVKLGKNPGGQMITATSDDQGQFTFENLEEGTYSLYISYDQIAKIAIKEQGVKRSSSSSPTQFTLQVQSSSSSVSIVSPRDAASGLPTGKRMHKPMTITKEWNAATPSLAITVGAGGGSFTCRVSRDAASGQATGK